MDKVIQLIIEKIEMVKKNGFKDNSYITNVLYMLKKDVEEGVKNKKI